MTGHPLDAFFVMLCVSLITCNDDHQDQAAGAVSHGERAREKCVPTRSAWSRTTLRTPPTSIIGSTSAILETPDLSFEQQHQLLEDARDDAQNGWSAVETCRPSTHGRGYPITKPGGRRRGARRGRSANLRTIPASRYRWLCWMSCSSCRWMRSSLEQAATNLLENAVRHGKTPPRLALSVHQEAETLPLPVQDTGSGIPPLLPVLFSSGTLRHSDTLTETASNMGLTFCMQRHCPRDTAVQCTHKIRTAVRNLSFCLR